MPLRAALQPDTPLQPEEKAELTISAHDPASRVSTPAVADSGRLEETVSPMPASGTDSIDWVRAYHRRLLPQI